MHRLLVCYNQYWSFGRNICCWWLSVFVAFTELFKFWSQCVVAGVLVSKYAFNHSQGLPKQYLGYNLIITQTLSSAADGLSLI